MKITIINCGHFESIVADSLTFSEMEQIKLIKQTLSHDEYAGYSPTEQNKYKNILKIVGNKIVNSNKI